ncbi:hypothetical protein pb186bvf_005867 [Paramecium bursaria]
MCLGPKCPCVCPKPRQSPQKFRSFRDRSPSDRQWVVDTMNSLSQSLIIKLRYTHRPSQALQFSIFALASLLGVKIMEWEKVQSLFFDYQRFTQQIANIDVSNLTEEQVSMAQCYKQKFDLVNDGKGNQVFANIAEQFIQKHQQYQQELFEARQQELATTMDEISELKIQQEVSPSSHNHSDILQSNERRKFTSLSKIAIRSEKSFRTPIRQFDHCEPVNHEDIISLRNEIKIIQKEIKKIQTDKKNTEYQINQDSMKTARKQIKSVDNENLQQTLKKAKQNEELDSTIERTYYAREKDRISFRKKLMQKKKQENNSSFEEYVRKYASKYFNDLDRRDEKHVELQAAKSQIKMLKTIRDNMK